ncbi:hypothetical protein EPIR_3498 [Erwinia piriflorinigrans CFBP 5888]|uniref:Uncharacterized protein n=1 Tax=Erwinia piriflorinigrans CFBP 5888 TaxID=1161919 RepID=V5ZD27_9GAMM|nr:hypothetical protein EPIR_3498 [Erwinia piriflorinigrans CFBP 5888]
MPVGRGKFNDIRDLHKSLLKYFFSYFINNVIEVTISTPTTTFALDMTPGK